jgi:HK97 family phage prohead protease
MTSQLAIGTKVESKEHNVDRKEGKEIASEHIDEIPDYYDRLKVMENPNFWRRFKFKLDKGLVERMAEHFKQHPEDRERFQKPAPDKKKVGKANQKNRNQGMPTRWNLKAIETMDYPMWQTAQVYREGGVDKCPCTDDSKKIRKADVFQTDPDDPGQEKEIRNLKLKSKLSPTKRDLKEVQEVNKDDTKDEIKKEWALNIEEMMKSDREFSGTFHKPVIDKENDIIPASAMDLAMNDFMVLPMLQEVHTERPIGIITKAWKTSEDEYNFVGKVKPTKDCDDVWKKIQKGEYDGLSIGGRRIKYSHDCSIPSSIRTTPCVTHRLKLYNVSVCSSPVNPEATVNAVAKAEDTKLVFDITETLLKAEKIDSNQSTKYDGVNEPMDEKQDDARGVSKSDDDPELITKSDITELTKAIGDFTKAAEDLSKSLSGFKVEHTHATQRDPPRTPGAKAVKMHGAASSLRKDEDPDEDPDPDPGKRVRKDEDPDEDPDPDPDPDPGKRRVKKAWDEPEDDVATLKKAYDTKIADLEDKIAKMGEQVIRKGGNAVVISEQLGKNDPMYSSNMEIFESQGMVTKT